jgi:hypothetical protein
VKCALILLQKGTWSYNQTAGLLTKDETTGELANGFTCKAKFKAKRWQARAEKKL